MSECLSTGGSGRVEQKMVPSLLLLSCEFSVSVKESLDRKKREKSSFVAKFVGIIVQLFSYKNVSQIPCKIFGEQSFVTDHLKHKNINKTTIRTPSEYPRQLCEH